MARLVVLLCLLLPSSLVAQVTINSASWHASDCAIELSLNVVGMDWTAECRFFNSSDVEIDPADVSDLGPLLEGNDTFNLYPASPCDVAKIEITVDDGYSGPTALPQVTVTGTQAAACSCAPGGGGANPPTVEQCYNTTTGEYTITVHANETNVGRFAFREVGSPTWYEESVNIPQGQTGVFRYVSGSVAVGSDIEWEVDYDIATPFPGTVAGSSVLAECAAGGGGVVPWVEACVDSDGFVSYTMHNAGDVALSGWTITRGPASDDSQVATVVAAWSDSGALVSTISATSGDVVTFSWTAADLSSGDLVVNPIEECGSEQGGGHCCGCACDQCDHGQYFEVDVDGQIGDVEDLDPLNLDNNLLIPALPANQSITNLSQFGSQVQVGSAGKLFTFEFDSVGLPDFGVATFNSNPLDNQYWPELFGGLDSVRIVLRLILLATLAIFVFGSVWKRLCS